MNFFLITGPPAVGKMTVGQQLAQKMDYKLFHNHHSIDLALNFFYYGDKEFKTINEGVRQLIFNTVAKSKNLKGFIFTLVWAFDYQSDWDYVADLKKLFTENGWNMYIVELYAPQAIRLDRNKTPNRLEHKVSKRNTDMTHQNILKMDEKYEMSTDGSRINEENYLWIDNSELTAEEVAEKIIERFLS